MGLSGIQIFKFLPGAQKTENANCKKCGCATCMAYAMKLAKGDISVDLCPYIDDELKKNLEQENKKPQVKVEFGKNKKVCIGDENVMFRHDKTFVNPCAFSITLKTSDNNFEKKLKNILAYKICRVGDEYGIDAITVINDSNDFESKIQVALKTDIPCIIYAEKLEQLLNLTDNLKEYKPLIYLKNQDLEEISEIAKFCPVIIDGENEEILTQKTEKLLTSGIKNIVLNLLQPINTKTIETLTMIRRSAIEKKFEPLGFPVMISYNLTGNISIDTIKLSTAICKYTNLIVLNKLNEALMTSILTLRMNIYTNPQKPLQVEPKLYEIGDVTPNSPVIVTTNFALTYFAVVNEIESLSQGTYLIITNSDGMSVLTAWSASKFTGEIIAKAVKTSGISKKVTHNNLIIPGLVGDLKEELEEELPEFNIIVGTNEATDLPDFLQNCR